MEKACAVCGEYFSAWGNEITCSEECKQTWVKLRDAKKKVSMINTAVNDLAKKAKEMGMSYGKYVEMMGLKGAGK